jgi:glycine/D-amino acid oxidase-like deaminating enzyme
MSSVDDDLTPRAALPGPITVDVAVIGAGLTGLWTAYYLAKADPTLRIAVLEAETAGFGASGRNGGWCSALFPQSHAAIARTHGRDAAMALYQAMRHTVDEVGRVAATEGIECEFAKGGTVVVARSATQLVRAREEVEAAHEFGYSTSDIGLLSASEAAERLNVSHVVGGTYTPHCAAIHPAKLVRGLARVVERLGVTIYEHTPVTALTGRTAETAAGRVRANVVVRATEGYTPRLRGHARRVAPLYSLMIATEPLPASFWESAGLAQRETFSDFRHMIIYGQRTGDDRLAFGGRGAPYHFGSAISPSFDRDQRVHADLYATMRELFPTLGSPAVTHRWGGPLGVTRDWTASVGLDRATGYAWAGGYVGDGVATTNLAGRTLADLIRGIDSDLLRLPWVNHRSPNWTPEPLRWLGINAGLRVMESADRVETRTGRSAMRAKLFGRLLGH